MDERRCQTISVPLSKNAIVVNKEIIDEGFIGEQNTIYVWIKTDSLTTY